VSDAEDVLTLGDLGAEGNSLLLGGSNFLGGLRVSSSMGEEVPVDLPFCRMWVDEETSKDG
jgi:hypothetical protein